VGSTIRDRQLNYCESSDEDITSSEKNFVYLQRSIIEFHLYLDSTFDFSVETSHGDNYNIVRYIRTLNSASILFA
jgi:hypothetical protein